MIPNLSPKKASPSAGSDPSGSVSWECHPPPLCNGGYLRGTGGPPFLPAQSQDLLDGCDIEVDVEASTHTPEGKPQGARMVSPNDAHRVPMNIQALDATALSINEMSDSLPGGNPLPSPAHPSLNSGVVDSFDTHGFLSPADFPPLRLVCRSKGTARVGQRKGS